MLEKLKNRTYTYDTRNKGRKMEPDRNVEVRSDEWNRMVAEAAYYIAERRGFEPGHEQEDWYQAEHQVREMMRRKRS